MQAQQIERLHGIDAVRAFALILGVSLHASLSFMNLHTGQIWPVMDVHRSTLLTIFFFLIHMFRMPFFFMLAGFFARMGIRSKGTGGFILDRLKRIALPLAVGVPIMHCLIRLLLDWGLEVSLPGETIRLSPFWNGWRGINLSHLWFLYFLLLFYTISLVFRPLYIMTLGKIANIDVAIDRLVRFITANPLGIIILMVPAFLGLWLTPYWRIWLGIPTSEFLIPEAGPIMIYLPAFGFGWLLNRQIDLLDYWARRWPYYLVAAIAAMTISVMLIGLVPTYYPVPEGLKKMESAAFYAISMWTMTYAMVGFAWRHLSGMSRSRRYLADSSYWIYVAHLPLVITLQILIAPYDFSPLLKFAAIHVVAFPLMLLSYEYLVRYSFIGAVLNGRKYRSSERAEFIRVNEGRLTRGTA